MPILVEGYGVRSGTKANACHTGLQAAQASMSNAHTINKLGWEYGLIGNHTMYKIEQKVW